MRISDWSSDVCSSDLSVRNFPPRSPFKRITGGGTGRWKQACHRTARASLCSLGDSGYHGSSGRCPALQAHLTRRCDNRSVGAPASIDVGPAGAVVGLRFACPGRADRPGSTIRLKGAKLSKMNHKKCENITRSEEHTSELQ